MVFILFALNSYYQPMQVSNLRSKHTIVRQINYDEDELTKEVINNSRRTLFKEFIFLNMQIRIIDKIIETNDSS